MQSRLSNVPRSVRRSAVIVAGIDIRSQGAGSGPLGYRKPSDLPTEGLLCNCGADDVVTRTFQCVILGFWEALDSRNDMVLNGLASETLRNLAREMDAWSLLTASPGGADPHSRPSVPTLPSEHGLDPAPRAFGDGCPPAADRPRADQIALQVRRREGRAR